MDDFGVRHAHFAEIIGQVLAMLYNGDVLSEINIREWYNNPPNDPAAKENVRKFV